MINNIDSKIYILFSSKRSELWILDCFVSNRSFFFSLITLFPTYLLIMAIFFFFVLKVKVLNIIPCLDILFLNKFTNCQNIKHPPP